MSPPSRFKERRVDSFHNATTSNSMDSGRRPGVIDDRVKLDPAARLHAPENGAPGTSRGLADSSEPPPRQGRAKPELSEPEPRSRAPTAPSKPVQRHGTRYEAYHDQSLFANPEEPVYLLSLDGGGVRGISEAVILHEIMSRIKRKLNLPELPKPCDYFHMIGGTSTGGLIAIMLGRLRMSTREVLHEYKTIAKKIFSFRNRRPDMSFRKTKLEQCVKSIVAAHADEDDERMISKNDGIKKGLSFVVSLRKTESEKANIPALFRSYKGTRDSLDCEIWEAARATTAAPRYFAPAQITLDGKTQYFIDGAVKWNNPTSLLLEEAESHFGRYRTLGCLVSLGTGLRPSPLREKGGGALWKSYSFSEMLRMATDMLTDPEPVHQAVEDRLSGHMDSYFRFSVPYVEGQERIRIHEWKRMENLRRDTEEYLKQKSVSDKLNELVDVLTNDGATDLTLQAACHANSAETLIEHITHKLQHRKTTTPRFTGREDVLELLDSWFFTRTSGSYPRRDFWLWGPSGIGKTQIALRFVDLYRHRFDKVWWIDAAMPYTGFERIASQVLDAPPKGHDLIPAVIDWLESATEEWLLIIDSYDSGDLSPLLPGFSRGNILFTSTRIDLLPDPVHGRSYRLEEMSLFDSTTLLLRAARWDIESEDLRARAKPVVEELGSLPLALNHAGAFLRQQRRCSLEAYLANLRQNKKNLLRDPKHKESSDRELAVYATFDLSLKRLRLYGMESTEDTEKATAYKSALELLNAFCFYHHEDIPLEILIRAQLNIDMDGRWDDIWELVDIADNVSLQSSESPGKVSTESREAIENIVLGICPRTRSIDLEYIQDGIMLLAKFSFLKQKSREPVFGIHPLVHSWLRDRMDPDTYQANFRLARTILFHAYNHSIHDAYSERFYPTLLPHMEANNALLAGVDSGRQRSLAEPLAEPLAELEINSKYAMMLKRVRLWDKVIPLLEQLTRDLFYELDPNSASRLPVMIELGKAYMVVHKISDAEGIYTEVMDRAAYCDNLRRGEGCLVTAAGQLSVLYLLQGDVAEAKNLAEDAVRLAKKYKRNLTEHHARLCLAYQHLSMWKEAEELAVSVVGAKTDLGRRGPEHHETMRIVAQLARIRAQRGKTDEAAPKLAEVAAKFERDLGPRNLETVAAKSDLAWVYYLQGGDGLGKSEELQRETLQAGRRYFGDRHPYTLLMIMRLGLVVGERGRFVEALALLRECKEGRTAVFGPKHMAAAGAGAAELLMLDKMKGGNYLERFGYTRRQIEIIRSTVSMAGFPYMLVWA